jgi:uncharacterized membrane protein
MNAAQIHLALNHAPLFLSALGGVILIIGMIRKNESFKVLSLYLLAAAAIFTIPVFLTGEGTEELVEHLPGVSENSIEEHEEMAKISLIVIAVSGVVAIAGLFLRKKASMAKAVFILCLLLSLASFGTMAQTAHLGGLIRHSEIQNGAVSAGADEKEDDEEDKKNTNALKDEQKNAEDSLKLLKKEKDDDD